MKEDFPEKEARKSSARWEGQSSLWEREEFMQEKQWAGRRLGGMVASCPAEEAGPEEGPHADKL